MFEDIVYKRPEPDPSEIAHLANTNAYLLLGGNVLLHDLLGTNNGESYCTFDPHDLLDKTKFEYMLDGMVEYFIEQEDYEKCAYLRDYTYVEYQSVVFQHQNPNF